MNLVHITASQAAEAIRAGKMTSEELVGACLGHIAAIEDRIGAWAHLDPDLALQQARDADLARQEGRALGPLHGVPVGVKDIFETTDMPTEDGTVLHAGRQAGQDATAVALLREAGAVIMGKTVTNELAVYAPGKTRNPHDPERTPGGSSSGSAAAVAACMVPFAVGTQTNGSIIRPASYCGVVGYKPTHGLISRHGVLQQSRLLDQVGVFARTIEDAALIAEQLMAFDDRDPDMRPRARPKLGETVADQPPIPPRLAFVKTPVWEHADEETRRAFVELVEHLGEHVGPFELPEMFNDAVTWHRTIMEADLAKSFEREYARGKDQLSATLRESSTACSTHCSTGAMPFSRPPRPARPPSASNRREARSSAPYGPCVGHPRFLSRCSRARAVCRWECKSSDPEVTTPGCCARPAGSVALPARNGTCASDVDRER
jgi:Asp-tRNA(Asn)/Glu-tRNA(Gln) amidotransferase A subunit family amidase